MTPVAGEDAGDVGQDAQAIFHLEADLVARVVEPGSRIGRCAQTTEAVRARRKRAGARGHEVGQGRPRPGGGAARSLSVEHEAPGVLTDEDMGGAVDGR